jgi:hypothetical protein
MLQRAAAVVLLTLTLNACEREAAPSARQIDPAAAAPGMVTSSQVSGRAPGGALITLEFVDRPAPPPEGNALMDQYAKTFVPETLFVRVGQEVVFRNSEDQLHNVTVIGSRTGTAVFDISQSPFETYKHTFERPGEFDVSCDVHPGMRATIVATTTPYAVYADPSGRFLLPNVAPGSYKLRISANGTQTERVVEIKEARTDLGA